MGTFTLGWLAAQISVYFFKKSSFVVALFSERGKIQEGCNSAKGDHCLLAHTMLEGAGGFSLRKGGTGGPSHSL